ncbi:hypothetical protein WJX79_008208 [Trebouxia sp. C0005]
MATIAEILYVWAKFLNWRERRRKQKKEMAGYQVIPEDLIFFRPVEPTDLSRIKKLEAAGYPTDEAASPAALEFRASQASDLFMVAVASGSVNNAQHLADTLVGYTCGTLTTADALTHESMSRHDPEGQTLCIHSVCVAAEHQRKGIARRMLKAYLQLYP